MEPLETTIGIGIAAIMIAAAVYFTWTQGRTLQYLGVDTQMPADQRRYLYKQCRRRLFGSFVLALLAIMLVGSVFLDYEPLRKPIDELPAADKEAAKNAVRLITFYWMVLLLFLMAMMALAIFDLWATARHGVEQTKKLHQEHQEMLAAELEELRHRQSGMN